MSKIKFSAISTVAEIGATGEVFIPLPDSVLTEWGMGKCKEFRCIIRRGEIRLIPSNIQEILNIGDDE